MATTVPGARATLSTDSPTTSSTLRSRTDTARRGERITRQGQPARQIYVIHDGCALDEDRMSDAAKLQLGLW